MSLELKLPELGENIDSGQVVKILVAPGESIAVDQPVLEVETGKATIEVPSAVAGKVIAVLVAQGDTVKVGQVLATLEPVAGEAKPAAAPAVEKVPAAPAAAPPEPAEAPPPAPPSPRAPEAVTTLPRAQPAAAPSPAVAGGVAAAAPHVRQFAREIGVDIQQVAGSGPGGRVSVEDVKRHAREAGASGAAAAPTTAARLASEGPLPDVSKFGPIERVPLSTIRQITAQQMSRAWGAIPHVMLESQADVTELEAFRQRYKARAEAAGGKLTVTAIMVRIVAAALREFPSFNASADLAAKELVLKKYVHVGVAADTPRGLLVPVVRDADKKTLVQLSVEVNQLAEKARLGKLAPVELQGGSMSVTNLGGLGVGHFTAVINHPEVAILALGKASMQPVWSEGQFQPRLMLPLSLSIDHRVIDGADGARFLRFVVDAIEQPLLLAL
ncbi:MAG: 2-oxo acid dehydrogenase subunit E2 [Deltaproteobacteria bacterium]|nr:2-oxo acid dehydrogenase subunit E2 [Deltaproteobacteria bacterium]